MNGLMLSNVRSVSAALAFTVAANSVTSVPVDNGDSQILNNIYLADTLKVRFKQSAALYYSTIRFTV